MTYPKRILHHCTGGTPRFLIIIISRIKIKPEIVKGGLHGESFDIGLFIKKPDDGLFEAVAFLTADVPRILAVLTIVDRLQIILRETCRDKETAFVDASAVSATDPVTIDAGNSGTTEYLLLPMAASLGVDVTITGDAQLRSRPVGPLAGALRDLGVDVKESSGKPPVTVRGPMKGGSTIIECRSSQYLSGLLLGAAMADGASKIDCSLLYEKPYVTLTLGWLRKQGIEFSISDDYEHAYVRGGQRYHGFDEYIAGDWSSASFFLAMAAMSGTSITVKGLDRDDPQGDKAILDVLEAMGASVSWNGNDVTVTGPDTLCGGDFDLNAIPDTLPILAVTAAAAEGTTRLGNVPQARIKETDRISCMRKNLETLGVRCEEEEDGLVIHGTGKVGGGAVKGFGDHRIIMAMVSAPPIME